MNKLFKFASFSFCLALFVLCFSVVTTKADDVSRYVISAKAGAVNFLSGNVTVERKKDGTTSTLTSKDKINSGDVITTGATGRAEITLNPGSYLRVGENSVVEFTNTNLDNLILNLKKGSAIVEAAGSDSLSIVIEVVTPQTRAFLVKKGIYRINVMQEQTTQVQVWKGQAEIGTGTILKLKGSKQITIGATTADTVKLEKKTQDNFDLWSKDRAKTLADARQLMERKNVTLAMTNYYSGFRQSNWGFRMPMYGSWCFDSRLGNFLFVPFDNWAWGSPYGFNYFDASFSWSFFGLLSPFGYYCPYRCGSYGYDPIYNNGGGNQNGGGGGGNTVTNDPNSPVKVRMSPPSPTYREPSEPQRFPTDSRPVVMPPSSPSSAPASAPSNSGNSPVKIKDN